MWSFGTSIETTRWVRKKLKKDQMLVLNPVVWSHPAHLLLPSSSLNSVQFCPPIIQTVLPLLVPYLLPLPAWSYWLWVFNPKWSYSSNQHCLCGSPQSTTPYATSLRWGFDISNSCLLHCLLCKLKRVCSTLDQRRTSGLRFVVVILLLELPVRVSERVNQVH